MRGILITGASGFVGCSLFATLSQHHSISTLDRSVLTNQPSDSAANQHSNIDVVVHLAGRAHVMHETEQDSHQAYQAVNVDYTMRVAEYAHRIGVKRFVFLSSIKVNGERTIQPFEELSPPNPEDNYGKSKHQAEELLKTFCVSHGMEYVIIRPPLIYGPGVKANFKALIKLAALPLPLPFGCVSNLRSFISLDNLNSFITLCCEHPLAANQTFLISDDHDVSLAALIRSIRKAFRKPACLLPCPTWLLKALFNLVGKPHYVDRLLGDLQLDITKAKTVLGWQPVISFDEGIRRTVEAYAHETSI